MKWRSFSVAGGGWYETLYMGRRYSADWWRLFWECVIIGNCSFYANKWFGWKPWLNAKNRRLLEAIEELEKMDAEG